MDKSENWRLSAKKKHEIANTNCDLPGNMKWDDKETTQLFAGKRLIRALGLKESDLYEYEQPYLSAPYEVHFSLAEKHSLECLHNNLPVNSLVENEFNTEAIKKAVDIFAEMGVSRIVFGEGESFVDTDILEIANYAREKGIVPDITTSGFNIDEKNAKGYWVFDRININFDDISNSISSSKREDSFKIADRAVTVLKKNKTSVGLNVVISAKNFANLGEICEYANSKRVKDVVLLRQKTFTNRIENNYDELGLRPDHLQVLLPITQRLTKRFGIKFRMDCSLFPSLAYHGVNPEALSDLDRNGCGAGNSIASMMPDGSIKACDFCSEKVGNVFEINSVWHTNSHLKSFRNWSLAPADPCTFCMYLKICNGGCRAITYYKTGSYENVDPTCPIVADFKRGIIHPALSAGEGF